MPECMSKMRGKILIFDQSNFHFSRGRRLKNRTASRPENVYHQPILRACAIYHGTKGGQALFVTNPSDFYVFCLFAPAPAGFEYVYRFLFHKNIHFYNKIIRLAKPPPPPVVILHITLPPVSARFSAAAQIDLERRGESRHIPPRKAGGHILRQSGQGREAATVTNFYMGRPVFHFMLSRHFGTLRLLIDRKMRFMV